MITPLCFLFSKFQVTYDMDRGFFYDKAMASCPHCHEGMLPIFLKTVYTVLASWVCENVVLVTCVLFCILNWNYVTSWQ